MKRGAKRTKSANRRSFPRVSDVQTSALRQLRQRCGFTLGTVATRAGLTLTRASYIERDPSIARQVEIEDLRAAINELGREAGIVIAPDPTAEAVEIAADLLQEASKR